VPLVECSDGHTFVEIGENTAINAFLASIDMGGDELLLNRDDEALTSFLEDRKARRHSAEGDSSLALTVMPAMAQGDGHIG
jgi:hypothetical protein